MEPSQSDSDSYILLSSSEDDEIPFTFDLPSELLLHTLRLLLEDYIVQLFREDACKQMVPLTLVARRWLELARPLTLRHVQIHSNRAFHLIPILSSPRCWQQNVSSLLVDFQHRHEVQGPAVLQLIASCCSLQHLHLREVGKPVFKMLSSNFSSVHVASGLVHVLGNLKSLRVCGTMKKQSTGSDSAKLVSFLLPYCKNLESLVRGRYTFRQAGSASLQPLPRIDLSPPPEMQLQALTSLTLISKHLGSRMLYQAVYLVPQGQLQELVLHCGESAHRRTLADIFIRLSPSLRIFKFVSLFPTHRLHQLMDLIGGPVLPFPNLKHLTVIGPIYTNQLLETLSTSSTCRLAYLMLGQSKVISMLAVAAYLQRSPVSLSSVQRHLVLDDIAGPFFSDSTSTDLAEEGRKYGWKVDAASDLWRNICFTDQPGSAVMVPDQDWADAESESDDEPQENVPSTGECLTTNEFRDLRRESTRKANDEVMTDDSDYYSDDWEAELSV